MNIDQILDKLKSYEDQLVRAKSLDGHRVFSVSLKFFQDKSGAILIEWVPTSKDPANNLMKVLGSVDNMTESVVFQNISELIDILERSNPSLN